MSDVSRDHDRHAEALGAYALRALPEDEVADLRAHLDGCADCRAELASLEAVVAVLPASALPVEAPAAVKGSVMSVVEAEADLLRAAGPPADRPAAARRRRGVRGLFPRPAVTAAAAAGALALGTAIGAVVIDGDSGNQDRDARIVAARIADPALPGARAEVQLEGRQATLVVRGMPPPPRSRVYQVWIKSAGASPVPAGATFSLRNGRVDIPLAVRRGQSVLVTHEPVGGSPSPTRAPIIVSRPV